jgi:hypothetical protein
MRGLAPVGHSRTMAYGYTYAQNPVRRSGPASIQVVAIIQYLGGLLTLLLAGLLVLVAAGGAARLQSDFDRLTDGQVDSLTAVVFVLAGFVGFIGLCAIILGRKLQTGRNWARIILIILNLLSVAGSVYNLLAQNRQDGGYVIGLAIPVLCLILLNTPAARSWCKYRTY